jgi:hypothetical protein
MIGEGFEKGGDSPRVYMRSIADILKLYESD